MLTQETALAELVKKIGTKEWFHSAEVEPKYGRDLVVYAKNMSADVFKSVPDKMGKLDVKLHFSSNKEASLDKFTVQPVNSIPLYKCIVKEDEANEDDINNLITQIWSLKKTCGKESLINIFYELHDKNEAITNDSEDYPEVREKLGALYDKFGFDVMFEEVEK